MDKILQEIAEHKATERAQWLDSVIHKAIPQWKINLLLKWNHRLLRKLLNADLEIIAQELIADFGIQYYIKLNGKVIAERKFIDSL